MTLVTIDLGDVAGGHDTDDHVVIRAEAFRESPGGGVTSTAEVKIPLVDGVGQAEVEPGPVVVSFRCRAVSDTREKRGVVPEDGPVGIEDVIAGAFEYTPPVVNRGLDLIEDARDEALGQVAGAVDTEISEHLDSKADKTQLWGRGPLGADHLDLVHVPGFYYQHDRDNATLENGYPVEGGIGGLEVTGSEGLLYQQQRYTVYDWQSIDSKQRIYIRSWQSGELWGAWHRIPTTDDLDAALVGKADVSHVHDVDDVAGAASVDYVQGAVDVAIDGLVAPLEEAVEATRTSRIFWESPPGSGLWEIGFEDTLNPRHDGLILYDTFSRVEAELVGSTPDVGIPWAGRAGYWSSDGSVARSSGESGVLSTDTSEKSMKLEARLHITAESGVAQSIRFYLGATTQTATNGYMVPVSISNTGFFSISPYTTIGGESARIGDPITGTGIGLSSGDSGTVDLAIEIDTQNVKVTATGPNGIPVESTGFLTEAQYGLLGTWAALHSATPVTDGFAVDSMKITTAPYPH